MHLSPSESEFERKNYSFFSFCFLLSVTYLSFFSIFSLLSILVIHFRSFFDFLSSLFFLFRFLFIENKIRSYLLRLFFFLFLFTFFPLRLSMIGPRRNQRNFAIKCCQSSHNCQGQLTELLGSLHRSNVSKKESFLSTVGIQFGRMYFFSILGGEHLGTGFLLSTATPSNPTHRLKMKFLKNQKILVLVLKMSEFLFFFCKKKNSKTPFFFLCLFSNFFVNLL